MWRRRLDPGTISHASQERFVDQITLVKVSGEYYELFEWHLDLFAAMQSQEVDASFEWKDPTIQQVLWRDSLATKVVDHERAAVGFNLEWRLVKLGCLRPGWIRVVEGQFAADDDQRTLNLDPASIVFDC